MNEGALVRAARDVGLDPDELAATEPSAQHAVDQARVAETDDPARPGPRAAC